MDKVSIKVEFTEDVDGLTYTDSLYFTPEEYETMSEKQLDAKKQERVDNYRTFITEAKSRIPVEPTKEELEQQKQMLQDQVAELDARIVKKLEVVEPVKGK